MLTALSVARDCGMIEQTDRVILAMVTPPIGTQPPGVEWTYAEDAKKSVTEVQPIRQVLVRSRVCVCVCACLMIYVSLDAQNSQ